MLGEVVPGPEEAGRQPPAGRLEDVGHELQPEQVGGPDDQDHPAREGQQGDGRQADRAGEADLPSTRRERRPGTDLQGKHQRERVRQAAQAQEQASHCQPAGAAVAAPVGHRPDRRQPAGPAEHVGASDHGREVQEPAQRVDPRCPQAQAPIVPEPPSDRIHQPDREAAGHERRQPRRGVGGWQDQRRTVPAHRTRAAACRTGVDPPPGTRFPARSPANTGRAGIPSRAIVRPGMAYHSSSVAPDWWTIGGRRRPANKISTASKTARAMRPPSGPKSGAGHAGPETSDSTPDRTGRHQVQPADVSGWHPGATRNAGQPSRGSAALGRANVATDGRTDDGSVRRSSSSA